MIDPTTGEAGAGRRFSVRWKLILGIGLAWLATFGLLFWSLRGVPLTQIWGAIAHLDGWQLGVLLMVNGLILGLMVVRWRTLLTAFGHPVGLADLFRVRLVGFSVSYLTPGPQIGGEPVQVDLLRRQGVALSAAISSVFLDRLVDLMANFTFLVLGLLIVFSSGVLAGSPAGISWAFAPGLLVLPVGHLAALWRGHLPLTWLLERLARSSGWQVVMPVTRLVRKSEEQISAFCRTQPVVLLRVIGLSALTWFLMIVEYSLTLYFLGVQASFIQAVSALTAARLAFLAPLPAALGALEASQVFAAQVMGWGAPVGVALSLIIRARDVLLAAFGMAFGGLAYRKVLLDRIAYEKRRL